MGLSVKVDNSALTDARKETFSNTK